MPIDQKAEEVGSPKILRRYIGLFDAISVRGMTILLVVTFSVLGFLLFIQLGMDKIDVEVGRSGSWSVPPLSSLNEFSGTLEKPWVAPPHKGPAWSIGLITKPGGKYLQFSCVPGGDALYCLYGKSGENSANIGEYLTIRYFLMSKILYPDHEYYLSGGNVNSVVTPQRAPAAIIMEAYIVRNDTKIPILSYDDSVKRLKAYMKGNPGYTIFPIGYIILGMLIYLIPPTIRRITKEKCVERTA